MRPTPALALLLLLLGCGRTSERSLPPVGVPVPISEPAAAPAWSVDVPSVEVSPGNLAVQVLVAGPPDAPDPVWAGLTVVKPDGAFEDTPVIAIPHASLGTPLTLTHAIGEGYTTLVVGVWKQAPPSCSGQPDCAGRLKVLGEALATWPPQSPEGHPVLGKIERRVRVRFLDLSRSGTLAKVVRQAVATRLTWFYPGPTYRLSIESDATPGDPRAAILVRYRDSSDDVAAESLAIDLRKAVTGAGVVTEHVETLPVPFVIDMGGDAQVSPDHAVPVGPRVMKRPGG